MHSAQVYVLLQTPITYSAATTTPAAMNCPECKLAVKFGKEIKVTLFAGGDNAPITFNSEKDFYTAMIVNKTFDFQVMKLK